MTGGGVESVPGSGAPDGAPHFLVHHESDHVGVAVQNVAPGPARVIYLDSEREASIEVLEPVPLGHKIALADLPAGGDLIEYGVRIGVSRTPIRAGQLVHVHNLRSARWQRSG